MKKILSEMWILLKSKIKDEKGSSAIFIAINISALVLLLMTLLNITQENLFNAGTDHVLNLSGRSVLSEYNTELKDRYGLIAFDLSPKEIKSKMSTYTSYAISKKKPVIMDKLSIETGPYSYANLDVFKEDVSEYSKYVIGKKILKISEKATYEWHKDKEKQRTLRNEAVIGSLPSRKCGTSLNIGSIIDKRGEFKSMLSGRGNKFLLVEYIMSLLNCETEKNSRGETFFIHEAEYIICGNLSDEKNQESTLRKIFLLRNGINVLHIIKDPSMMAEVSAMAAIIAPGPGALIMEGVLVEAWAFAESKNDVEILKHGGRIPFVKTGATWAVSLSSIVKGKRIDYRMKDGTYIDNGCKIGMSYKDFLRIFLILMDEETLLYRLMDIMQINIQGSYDGEFLIETCQRGFDFSATVKGKKYVYKEKY